MHRPDPRQLKAGQYKGQVVFVSNDAAANPAYAPDWSPGPTTVPLSPKATFVFAADAAANTVALVQGKPLQTGPLHEWQTSDGVAHVYIKGDGTELAVGSTALISIKDGDVKTASAVFTINRSAAGANADTHLTHRGTGSLFISAFDAGSITVRTNGIIRNTLSSGGAYNVYNAASVAKLWISAGENRLNYDVIYPGSNGQFLKTVTGVPAWAAMSSSDLTPGSNNTALVTNNSGTVTWLGGSNSTVLQIDSGGVITFGSVTNAMLSSSSITVTSTGGSIVPTGSPVSLGGSINLDLPVQGGVTPGSYTKSNVTVNGYGIVTAISSGSGALGQLIDYKARLKNVTSSRTEFSGSAPSSVYPDELLYVDLTPGRWIFEIMMGVTANVIDIIGGIDSVQGQMYTGFAQFTTDRGLGTPRTTYERRSAGDVNWNTSTFGFAYGTSQAGYFTVRGYIDIQTIVASYDPTINTYYSGLGIPIPANVCRLFMRWGVLQSTAGARVLNSDFGYIQAFQS